MYQELILTEQKRKLAKYSTYGLTLEPASAQTAVLQPPIEKSCIHQLKYSENMCKLYFFCLDKNKGRNY